MFLVLFTVKFVLKSEAVKENLEVNNKYCFKYLTFIRTKSGIGCFNSILYPRDGSL